MRGVAPSILRSGPLRLRFRLYDLTSARVTVRLADQEGRRLKTRRGYSLKPGRADLRWPATHGARLVPSTYELSLSAVDEAGNIGASTAKRFLVIRPVRARVWADFRHVGRRIALTFHHLNCVIHAWDLARAIDVSYEPPPDLVEQALALARKIPGATIHDIPAGHAACVLESERFVPALLDAVNTVNARRRDQRRLSSA